MERRGNFLPSTATGAGAAAKSLPVPSPAAAGDAAANLTSSSGSSSSLTLSPPNFLRQVHAAFKRHRPLGTMQSNFPRATRVLVSRGDLPKSTSASPSMAHHPEGKDVQQHGRLPGGSKLRNAAIDRKQDGDAVGLVVSSSDGLSLTPPSILGTITDAHDQNAGHSNMQKNEIDLMVDRKKSALEVSSSQMASESALVEGDFKKDRFYAAADAQITSQSDCVGGTVDSRMDSISYLHSLSLTAGDSYAAAQVANDQDGKHQDREKVDSIGMDIKYNAANLPHRGVEEARNPHHGELVTRCSAIGSSITTLSLHSGPTVQSTRGAQHGQYGLPTQMSECAMESSSGMPVHGPPKQHGAAMSAGDWNSNNQQVCNLADVAVEKAVAGNAGGLPSQGLSANNQSLSIGDQGASQPNKGEKERRKKNYNPDVFFKVNGKLYQKLGKIGSGGSSEVHKVISAECTIYALKKIKLKGRDYPTAYGFCQEIEYLNKLKGKTNIIQLIDYEVTDKQLLQEGSTSPRDGRIKDDHYIYMVLEYGEIDLAHMVSLKWKEMNNTSRQIDENWLRFYWQQMLEAVNTIHEERIVHSDLKPANFLLVRGSLKLIDFGIAKAIMNDTTNIQRDAQVGTLNYMSPEAFMCNEQDTGGNIIKCGRPSDIWSLGCILYQMVYGKTPFADYKTFWAKFKVVTDRNHKIHYEPVANPWLIDLMQRCLAWDRNERWRIPQLLQHPFLVPLAPRDLPAVGHDPCKSLMERVRLHWDNPKVSKLCSELHTVITELEEDQGVSTTKMEQET